MVTHSLTHSPTHSLTHSLTQEINQLRRMSVKEGGMAFKANPIVTKDKYPCAHVKAAPLTQPKSPYLLTKQRAKTH